MTICTFFTIIKLKEGDFMQFITTDQRIAVENFEVGLIYTVTFSNGDSFTGACIGIGPDFVAFQRTAPKLLFCLTMTTAADIAGIDPLGDDIGKILEYTGTVPISIKTDGSPLLDYLITGNTTQTGTPTPENPIMPQGTGERTGNLWAGDVPRYSYGKDYKKYNPDNAVYIKAGTYTISSDGKLPNFQVFDDNHTQYRISEIMTFPSAYYSVWGGLSISPISAAFHTATITILADCIITLTVVDNIGTYIMLNSGSTPLPFEPFGFKIPILSGDTITNIYLDNPLRKSLDGTAVDELSSNGKLTQRVDTDGSVLSTPIISYIDAPTIPTTDGLNIFDIDTTLKPSEVYLKYFSPLF